MNHPIETIYDVIDLVAVSLKKRDCGCTKDLKEALTIVKKWEGLYKGDIPAALELIENAHSIIDEYRDLVMFKEAVSELHFFKPSPISHQEHMLNFNRLQKMLENRPYDPMKDAFSK